MTDSETGAPMTTETANAPGLSRLAYASVSQVEDHSEAFQTQIRDILSACARHNAKDGLSGVLIHDGGHFIQYLEGPHDALGRCFETIRGDERHTDLLDLIANEPCDRRAFPSWSMAYVEGDVSEIDRPRGAAWRELRGDPLMTHLDSTARLRSVLSVPFMPQQD